MLTGDASTNWKDTFRGVMHSCIPCIVLTKRANLPWLTSDLKRLMKVWDTAYKRAKKTCLSSHCKKKKNKVPNLLKRSKVTFSYRANPSDPKSFWKTVKVIQKKESQIPFLMSTNRDVISENTAEANL